MEIPTAFDGFDGPVRLAVLSTRVNQSFLTQAQIFF
jgi:hypothetical protein